MAIQDKFIREIVETCYPHKSVSEKYRMRKGLAKTLKERIENGNKRIATSEPERRYNGQMAQLVICYDNKLRLVAGS